MDPMLDPVVQLASSATSFDDFLKKLKGVQMDPNELIKSLATATFKARGLGDATDEVK